MKVQKVGYARVSTTGQSLDIQLEKLEQYGCDKIFKEKSSGIDDKRVQLNECLNYVREGDQLVISRLDRMARSALHLGKIVERLKDKEVNLVVLDQNIDTSTPHGMLMFQMLSSFAEFEYELKKERQVEGIKKAVKNGVKFGRPTKVNAEIVKKVKEDISKEVTVRSITAKYGISVRAYYKIKNGACDHLVSQ
ncbi:recombinase family protein [Allofrancisella guangzhouensis]|nr:recombinase family protein [Allofrancisella guangzhouensis]MBK2044395.1 recombinase family protein [Allofrancisella guangzhouensis]MBK2046226.1 recombinase family protein [Allofrancisella guangzhouensis]